MSTPWFLYLLECEGGSVYTGITTDVDRRYAQHLAGTGAKYTRSRKPRRLLVAAKFDDRAAASKAEAAVKRLSALQKRALCEHMKADGVGLVDAFIALAVVPPLL